MRSFEESLKRALLLVREFRLHVYAQDLDPTAVRVAIKFMLLADTHIGEQHGLTAEEDKQLDAKAEELFEMVKEEWERHGLAA